MNATALGAMSATDMRDAFFTRLYDIAASDPAIVVLSNDFGAPSLDRFRAGLPGQFINAAISEQNMISMAAGMAMAGRKPVVYSIASFLTLRALEQIKVDVCVMGAKVLLLGVGCGYAYSVDGPTHHATEDIAIMRVMSGMTVWSPSEPFVAGAMAEFARDLPGPAYLRFDRGRWPSLGEFNLSYGLRNLGNGDDVVLVSTGIMTHRALAVADTLRQSGVACRVIDLLRLSPPQRQELGQALAGARRVVTLEEQAAPGGLGGMIAEFLADEGRLVPLLRLAIDPSQVFAYGERDRLHQERGLDVDGACARIMAWRER